MEPPVVNKPKVNITPKITKISSLAQSAEEIKKTSAKLKKTFESGSYQKKTQLTVLNRYKKRLDSIQKQNDKRFLKKQRVKVKLPEIRKFAGNFFSAGSDPLKSIGALAAFNALTKGAKGDLGGAIGPALVAAGLFFGPGLLKGGLNLARGGISKPGTTPIAKPLSSGSISRVNASQARFIQGQANIGDRARLVRRGFISPMGMFSRGGVEETAKYGANSARVGKAFGRFGKAIIPGVGAAIGAIDANMRAQEGDRTGAAIAGTSATLDALAAASAATGIGLPVAGLLSIASFALDVTNLVRDLSGASEKEAIKNKPEQDRLKKQTEEQKKLVERKEGGTLTFGKSLGRYEKVVNKFEEFSKSFTGGMGMGLEQMQQTATRIEDLGGGADPISTAGYEFTGQSSFSQYLTGDPNAAGQAYDPAHGGENYHDHLAFKDADTARRAYQFLQSKGITVTELGVTSGHTAGSAHYEGRAFDVPGYQWGATGPIDERHYRGSAKVRAFMNDFYNLQTLRPQQNQAQVQQPVSPVFQRPQTSQGLSIGAGGFNIGGQPIQRAREYTPPSRPSRSISQYTSYDPRGQMEQVIPVPIPIPQQQMMQEGGSESMMIPGPSEQDLLNSFYKRVLLNTVA